MPGSLRLGLLAAALALGAAAGRAQAPPAVPEPPDVAWEFVGADSARVAALALLDPADGRPFGLADAVYATLYYPPPYLYPGGEYPYPVSFGLARLHDGAPSPAVPPDSAWAYAEEREAPYGIYAAPGGLVIAVEGSGGGSLTRSTDGGQTWADVETEACRGDSVDDRIVRTYGPGRERALWLLAYLCRSDDEGATWRAVEQRSAPEYVRRRDLVELPPSPMLPEGRLVLGVGSGVLTSDDGGHVWEATSLYQEFRWVGHDLVLVPDGAHPYGGTVYVLARDFYFEDRAYNVVLASDDGGATWAERHRFVYGENGLDRNSGEPEMVALGDGSLVVGLVQNGTPPQRYVGTVVWSGDGGRTWSALGPEAPWLGARPPAGACERACPGGAWPGWGPKHLRVDRDGRVWAGTDNGVWRTTCPAWAVASEAGPGAPSGLGLSVRPNPSRGRAEVVVTVAEAGPVAVRVTVLDVLGREVAVVWDGAARDGQRVAVDGSGWPAGVYTVRAASEAGEVSARLTVVR
ncbi:exo-alpha-sialidase [Rubrivirga marina]|uniref:Sialidase domain-containing protein n=1 Tax=Rubrivirga marina TaxID=1196024 RepID=A0A271IW18_9BACT|nr:exo-alpha-sialidase [Rubrivirga marina]PAP75310.1 hypothetical protein BSZ37_02055 [Rubrivirga marina]